VRILTRTAHAGGAVRARPMTADGIRACRRSSHLWSPLSARSHGGCGLCVISLRQCRRVVVSRNRLRSRDAVRWRRRPRSRIVR
jgi:hypothetical protein